MPYSYLLIILSIGLVFGKRGVHAAKVTFFSDIQLCLPEKVSISAIDLTFLSSFSYVSLHFQHVKEHQHNTYVTWIVAQRYGGFGRKTNDMDCLSLVQVW
jgi:hypothetical protein